MNRDASVEAFFEERADEARQYALESGMVIATREERLGHRVMYVARFMRRLGDTLYETGGMGQTEDEAVSLAYVAWKNYWRGKGEPEFV